MIVTLEESPSASIEYPPEIHQTLKVFHDIMSDELLEELPTIRDIQHIIDFVSGSAQLAST